MRSTTLALVCLLVCAVAAWGANTGSGTDPLLLTAAEVGHGELGGTDPVLLTTAEVGHQAEYGQATDQQAQQQEENDPDRPVLKRRRPTTGPDARTGEPQQPDQNSNQNNPNSGPQQSPAPPQSADQQTQDQNAGQPAASNGPVLEQRTPRPTYFPASTTIPLNTRFQVALDEALSTKTSHSGDTFTATLDEPLRSSRGDVLIPSGSKILGTVQDAEPGKVFASMRGKGHLILRFDTVVLPDGRRLPMQTTLLSVGRNKGNASANQEGEITSGTKAGDAVKKVGIGAGVGTVAGLIFGSALKGAAIGAIAGGGYAMANAGKDVELPAHTTVNLRLDQYLIVPQH